MAMKRYEEPVALYTALYSEWYWVIHGRRNDMVRGEDVLL